MVHAGRVGLGADSGDVSSPFFVPPARTGKTYNALQALREADTGVFCSPLRLLALEVYENLNMSGVYVPSRRCRRHVHTRW